jgi:hypothetical protein
MTVEKYTSLITSEHADKPNYMAMIQGTCQPFADMHDVLSSISALYDLDVAVGAQLDTVGQWIGISRNLNEAIADVYFAFDTSGVGFDQGVWYAPYDPISGLVSLPDDHYRLLLRAKILNNSWPCNTPTAYTLLQDFFAPLGFTVFIIDPANLTMALGIIGASPPDPLLLALMTSGELNLRPAGIEMLGFFYQNEPGPMFAFDIETANFAGFDTGSWAQFTTGTT